MHLQCSLSTWLEYIYIWQSLMDLLTSHCLVMNIYHSIHPWLWCALFCCGDMINSWWFIQIICPYSSGLLHWHWGNRMIAHWGNHTSASEATLKHMGILNKTEPQQNQSRNRVHITWYVLYIMLNSHHFPNDTYHLLVTKSIIFHSSFE